MPGLFGFAVIDNRREIDRRFAESMFSQMVERLHHHPSHQIDRWNDRTAGVFLGRIGAPHVNLVPWASFAEENGRKAFAFFAGTLHTSPGVGGPSAESHARRFLDSGVSSIDQLRGFYATVVHVSTPATTVIATDRRASVPIYYAKWGGMLFFAPEPKALLTIPELPRDLDLEAVTTFLASGHTLGHQCLLKSIRRLRGGEALLIEQGRLERRVYWNFSPGSRVTTASDQELEEELGQLVEDAVVRNLGDPNRTVIFLSGGGDSRGILGGALAAVGGQGKQLSTVCWGARRGADTSDAGIAERIASSFQLKHRFVQRKIHNYDHDFPATNYLLDAQSDIAALHPYEYRLMVGLNDAGFDRALRGDHAFGRRISVHNSAEALAEVGLRRLGDLALVAQYANPSAHSELLEASDAAIDSVLDSVQDLDPNDAQDFLSFNHRLQGYLNSAAYYKQLVLDTRNVLLDEDVLDFLERVPARLRISKVLYRRAMRRRYPALWKIPMSTERNLEDWTWHLGNDSPLRRFVSEQLDDAQSGIWQYFDRVALRTLLDSLVNYTPSPVRSGQCTGRTLLRKTLFSVSPRFASAIHAGREAKHHPPNRALLRVMVLKDWYDTFITGDGRPGNG